MFPEKTKQPFILRPLCDDDIWDYADLLFSSFNAWWWKHGLGRDFYECSPQDTAIFYQVYNDLTPGCSVAAIQRDTGRMMGACYYHPREFHVSLGIMAMHPNYVGYGIARAFVRYILDYTREQSFKACRLVCSAMNLDSFSLYNRSGFIPRAMYQDMLIDVPPNGIRAHVSGEDNIRDAAADDVEGMGELELYVSGVKREIDYRYAIENPRGVMHASVYENEAGAIDGFMISLKHPALNILGPCVGRSEEVVIALIRRELDRFKGLAALFVVPMQKRTIVEQLYDWKAVNVETHVKQVWGEFQEFRGVSLPSYLPETG